MTYNYDGYLISKSIDLAKYLAHKLGERSSPVRIHKAMYLMHKGYTVGYGNIAKYYEGDVPSEFDGVSLPNKLFPANFEAWKFGPVERDVYDFMQDDNKSLIDNPDDAKLIKDPTQIEQDILEYIEDMMSKINEIHDFGLIHITQDHNDYKQAIKNGNSTPIPENWIVADALTQFD